MHPGALGDDGVVRGGEVGQHTEKLDLIPPPLYLVRLSDFFSSAVTKLRDQNKLAPSFVATNWQVVLGANLCDCLSPRATAHGEH